MHRSSRRLRAGLSIEYTSSTRRMLFEDGHLHAPRMQELVPRLLELMEGGIEDGIRFLQPFRPAR
jgi:hypothetical protein